MTVVFALCVLPPVVWTWCRLKPLLDRDAALRAQGWL